MKRINRKSAAAVCMAAGAISILSSQVSAQAVDGTWAAFQSGIWSDSTKWVNSTIPDNGGTASLVVDNNTNSGATLTVDTNRTVQNLIFGNITGFANGPSVGTMNVASSGGAILTLADTVDVTPTTPTIIVPSMGIQTIDPGVKTVTIAASLAGSQGVNLKFGSFIGDTYTVTGVGQGQYTTNHNNTVTISGNNNFTGGVLTADGVGSINLGNANALKGLSGFVFDNINGNTGSNANNLYILGNNTVGTNVPMTLKSGAGDRRLSMNNQSGFTSTYAGNVTLTGSSAIQLVENGANGQLIFSGNMDGTALTDTALLMRGTNTTATRTFGQINGNLNFPTSSATGLIAKTDPGLWILNSSDTTGNGIVGYRVQVSAGTLRVTNQAAVSASTAVVLGQRSGTADSAIYETNGNLTTTLGSGPGQLSSPFPMGLSAGGGALNVNLNGGAALQFGAFNSTTLDTTYATATGTAGAASSGNGVVTLSADPATLGLQVGDYAFYNTAATASPSRITAISGNTITLDLPITAALSSQPFRFYSPTKLNDVTMFLNSFYATNNLTMQNAIDLNGHDRSVVVYAKTATLSGNLSNSSATAAGLVKLNIGSFGTGTLELTGSNSFTNGVSVRVGTLSVGNDYALGTGALQITTVGNTAATIANGAVVLEPSLNHTAVVTGGLSLVQASGATGTPLLDLGVSNMVLNYAGSTPITDIQAKLASNWIKTTAAGEVVGYGEATTLFPSGGSFFNATLAAGVPALLMRTTYSGDANLDGIVNTLDFNALATNFGATAKFWTDGDFTNDGTVNSDDFAALAGNFGRVLPSSAEPLAATASSLGSIVPEPSCITLLTLGVAGLRHRRRTAR